ncbi:MAG: hypothetical protein RLZZ488_1306 [Pseudomonadota bacterium]|jgi:hypothetical protein
MRLILAKKLLAGLWMTVLTSSVTSSFAAADARADTFKSLDSDSADHSCQIVLRQAELKRDSNGQPQTETDASGVTWYVFESTVDVAIAPLSTGTSVYLLYRNSEDPLWHVAPGLTIEGAPKGMQRLSFRIHEGTLPAASGPSALPSSSKKLHIIPFLQTADGRRIFDHNSSLSTSDSLVIDSSNKWSINTPPTLCPSAGRGSGTLRFLGNWTMDQRGLPQPGHSLVVEYDLARLPQCHSSSYNGLPAWQTDASIRFFPNGEEYSASLNSLQNGKMVATPARFEIPAEATHAQVWFKTRGRNCEAVWDSNYGRNYEFSLRADVASSPSWAGQWRLGRSTGQCQSVSQFDSLPEEVTFSEGELKSCKVIEAEVLVPGLTTAVETSPEAIQAQVRWSLDGVTQQPVWLTFAGRSGQNFRYRWTIPSEFLSKYSWRKIEYSFQFSTDGLFWLAAGRSNNRQNGTVHPRTIEYRAVP